MTSNALEKQINTMLNSPLFWRDDTFNNKINNFTTNNNPPYNITKEKDGKFKVEVAVAGYPKENLSVEVRENALIISGEKVETEEEYSTKGIQQRAFKLQLLIGRNILADDAEYNDGILTIYLSRIEEDKKLISIK